ncbi:MAG: cache domain-containing protein [Desulfovibrio sp.]|nr:cache domain-containing protein [Desulfovibrio sp.]
MLGKVAMSEPVKSKSLGEKAIIVAAPVTDERKDILGVIYGIMTTNEFTKRTIGGVTIGKTGYSYLVNARTGLITAHENSEQILKINMFKTQPWMRNIAPNTSGIKAMMSNDGI